MSGVWILAELDGGLPARITFELLTAGRRLADALGQPLGVVMAGPGASALTSQLVRLGADRVAAADLPAVTPETIREVLVGAWPQLEPTCLLAGHTPFGTEVAARLAVRLEAGLVTDCVGLEAVGDTVVGLRSLPDGGMARVIAKGPLGLMTLRPGLTPWPTEAPERSGAVVPLEVPADIPAPCLRILESTPVPAVRLTDAEDNVLPAWIDALQQTAKTDR